MTPKDKRPVGRPSTYTTILAEEFCRRIASGRSQRSVCADPDMPGYDAVERWQTQRPEFASRYARARDGRADVLADEALAICDELSSTATSEQVQAARLRIDTRRWFASKLSPKKFGDRVQTDATVNANVTGGLTVQLSAMSDDELARILVDAARDGAGGGVGVAPKTSP